MTQEPNEDEEEGEDMYPSNQKLKCTEGIEHFNTLGYFGGTPQESPNKCRNPWGHEEFHSLIHCEHFK
jgi:hypothetical protein